MSACYQFENLTTLEHGYAVLEKYQNILKENEAVAPVPDWFRLNSKLFLSSQMPCEDVFRYLIYHDCAKFKVFYVDGQGKSHFPEHANASKTLWEELFGPSLVSELIGRDMDMHLVKPSNLKNYDRLDLVPTLLVCAWAELLANAEMFGGVDSVSFKIKFKALSRLGNTFLKL